MLKYSWMSPRLFSPLDTRLNEISYNYFYCIPKETGYGFLHNPNKMKLFLEMTLLCLLGPDFLLNYCFQH